MTDIPLHPEYGVNPTILLCPVCCNHDGTGLALLGSRSKLITGQDEAPRYMMGEQICDDCQKKFDDKYIAILEADPETKQRIDGGRIAWMREHVFKDIFGDPPENRACLMATPIMDELMKKMPTEDV